MIQKSPHALRSELGARRSACASRTTFRQIGAIILSAAAWHCPVASGSGPAAAEVIAPEIVPGIAAPVPIIDAQGGVDSADFAQGELPEHSGLSALPSGAPKSARGLLERPEDPPEPSLSTEAGSAVMLVATSIPEASLRAIARDAARLGVALAFSGLPVRARTEAALRRLSSERPDRPPSPLVIDREAFSRTAKLLSNTGALAGVAPGVWHAVRDALADEPAVPALALFGSGAIEVFPGDALPREALARAAREALDPEVRAAAAERLSRAAQADQVDQGAEKEAFQGADR